MTFTTFTMFCKHCKLSSATMNRVAVIYKTVNKTERRLSKQAAISRSPTMMDRTAHGQPHACRDPNQSLRSVSTPGAAAMGWGMHSEACRTKTLGGI